MRVIITTGVIFCITMLVVFTTSRNNNNGIHPIGEEAVYISGEACIVNMTFRRSETSIIEDMMECVDLHREADNKDSRVLADSL
jgi:hypothetical protein